MNILDLGDKATSANQMSFWSFACFQVRGIPDHVSQTYEGEVSWPDSLLEISARCSSDLRLTVPVRHCLRDQQIMLTSREKLFGKRISVVRNPNESL